MNLIKVLFIWPILLCGLAIIGCDRPCRDVEDELVKKLPSYKHVRDILVEQKALLKKRMINPNDEVILWITKDEFEKLVKETSNERLKGVSVLWDENLVVEGENKVILFHSNSRIQFLVRQCSNFSHYIVYDPQHGLSHIGVTDDIFHQKIDNDWEYVIQKEDDL
ncbi:hypothetical protein QNI16_31290 [Cytophagaceae bacterium YF14B1]|uniref:Lipoprotein n=1 Tax=Xanthocytophaga flava TaxID=3048013 RepID=A0AAE3U9E8_9BACT|nr:hypothetical protein [Xanthocytophaga flavus]MDJ1485024.1 hypothetical protein [Xanthocytophaga flavus]